MHLKIYTGCRQLLSIKRKTKVNALFQQRTMKRIIAASSLLFLSITTVAQAATFRGGEEVNIAEPIQDDAYIGGGQIIVRESITGDLITAGGEINIQGNVDEDIIAGGGRVTISGNAGDDVRAAGGEVLLSGSVADDLFLAGGRVTIDPAADISGDVHVAGGEILIDGRIRGNLKVDGGRVVLNGSVDGEVRVQGGDLVINGVLNGTSNLVADEIKVGDAAELRGDVTYWTRNGEMDFGDAALGTVTYNPDAAPVRHDATSPKILFIGTFIALGTSVLFAAFFIILVTLLTKTMFIDSAKVLGKDFWPSALRGFLFFAVTPIVCLILLMTVVGIPVSLLVFSMYVFVVYFSKALSAMVITRWLEIRYKQKWNTAIYIILSIGVFIVLKLVVLVPVAGWIACFLVVSASMGALMTTKWAKFKKIC